MPLLLPAGNPSPWTGPTGNNTWLIMGRLPTLIDAGVGHPEHIAALRGALGGKPLARILITHGHVDHVSGIPALRELWPDVQVHAYGGGTERLRHDEYVPVGDGRLRVLHTPGHSPDHCCFFDEERGDMYCGDLARAGGTVVIPATRGGNLAQYLDSLRLVKNLAPGRLFPGHGPIVENPQALISDYLAHRAERDEQIVAVLRLKARVPADIAGEIYPDLNPAFERAALETVLAHLIKLRDQGRVSKQFDDLGDELSTWIHLG